MVKDSHGIVIDDDRMYDLPACAKLGFGPAALRAARRKHNLLVYRSGRKSWVEGRELKRVIKAGQVITG